MTTSVATRESDSSFIQAPATGCGVVTLPHVLTANDRERRSLALAARYGMTSRDARRAQSTILGDGREQFSIHSRTNSTRFYPVTYDPISHLTHCECPSRCGCWHVGTVLLELERREREWQNARAWDRDDWREMCEIGAAFFDSRERAGSEASGDGTQRRTLSAGGNALPQRMGLSLPRHAKAQGA